MDKESIAAATEDLGLSGNDVEMCRNRPLKEEE